MAERHNTSGVPESLDPGYRLAARGRQEAEDDRLGLLEDIFDPLSCRRRELVQPGWRCLEVGAGRGSMAVWLAERVGPCGQVVATDSPLDRFFLLVPQRASPRLLGPTPRAGTKLIKWIVSGFADEVASVTERFPSVTGKQRYRPVCYRISLTLTLVGLPPTYASLKLDTRRLRFGLRVVTGRQRLRNNNARFRLQL
jgi:hypothetical protein